jgi:Synergist-CTERM protein sorting domain-containing protein
MLRRLAVLASLAAAPALAAAQTVIVTESNDTDAIINAGECVNNPVDQLAFAWTPSVQSTSYDLYASDTANCPAEGTTTNGVTNNAHTRSFATGINRTSLNQGDTASKLLNLAQIQCNSSSSALFICVFPNNNNTTPVATASVTLDLAFAPAPVLNPVSPGDSSLQVSWQLGAGTADGGQSGSADRFDVYYAPTSDLASEKRGGTATNGRRDFRLGNLTNGVEYRVRVKALTIGGNQSDFSNEQIGTPHVVDDFWRLYQNAGGQERGGCATGAAGLTALVALTPLILRRRKRRRS